MEDFQKNQARLLKLIDEVETDDESLDDENPSDPDLNNIQSDSEPEDSYAQPNTEFSSEDLSRDKEQEIDRSPFFLGEEREMVEGEK
ncbi:hypothetical protein JTB14_029522 [Gonioctena quinquepunctata]|nr:hypothetical protein JTB14_029522 [Gonioctena quinquepunctata]